MTGRHSTSRPQRDDLRDSRDRDLPPRESTRGRQWFIPGDGIEREVIQSDICRYLGRDALVRPFDDNGQRGFMITAYRTLTSQMIEDLKRDSAKFAAENRQNRARGYRPVSYDQSETYASAYDDSIPTTQGQSNYSSYPKRSQYDQYDQYDQDQGQSSQYFGSQQMSQAPGFNPNYQLSGQGTYGNQPQRDFAQGSPGVSYQPFEPRQEGYPRTPQSQDESIPTSRAPVSFGVPHSTSQQYAPQPSRTAAQNAAAYIDPTTGRTVYVDSGYVERRAAQGTRVGDRDRRMR